MGKTSGWGVVLGGLVAWVILHFEQAGIQYGWEAWMELQVRNGLLPQEVLQYVKQPEQGRNILLAAKLGGALALSWLCALAMARTGMGPGIAVLAGMLVWAFMFLMSTVPAIVLWPLIRMRMIVGALGDLAGYLAAAGSAGWIISEFSTKEAPRTPARRRR